MPDFTVIIPSLNPDGNLSRLAAELTGAGIGHLIVVNDGSGAEYDPIFADVERQTGCIYLKHEINRGKGAALKTAFREFLRRFPDDAGIVSCDADGQHTAADILRIGKALVEHPDCFILGVRDFNRPGIPFKSRFGNRLTRTIFLLTAGLRLSDTQTGLRGLPKKLVEETQTLPGERFEYETDALLAAKENHWRFLELPIATIYENGNRGTHFRPFRDALNIYRVIFAHFAGQLGLFIAVAGASFALDMALSGLLYYRVFSEHHLLSSLGLARLCSSSFNYLANRYIVFRAKRHEHCSWRKSLFQYYSLALVVFGWSYLLTRLGVDRSSPRWMLAIKAAVDVALFCCNFFILRLLIFRKKLR